MEDATQDGLIQLLQTNRKYKRGFFKLNRKFFGVIWAEWNGNLPKRQPIISERNKSRIGYRRRNHLA